jgi:hypothetical protein
MRLFQNLVGFGTASNEEGNVKMGRRGGPGAIRGRFFCGSGGSNGSVAQHHDLKPCRMFMAPVAHIAVVPVLVYRNPGMDTNKPDQDRPEKLQGA